MNKSERFSKAGLLGCKVRWAGHINKTRDQKLKDKREWAVQRRIKMQDDPAYVERVRQNKRRWRENNRHKENLAGRMKRKSDPSYRFLSNMRSCINLVLRGAVKSGSTEALLGCSISQFMSYIESLFSDGMSWDKFGRNDDDLQIDHVIPCSMFDMNNPNHQTACFNYKNMRPMWRIDNILKSDILPDGRRARNLSRQEKDDYIASLFK